MLGWCADFLRLLWGLLYWNIRKTWYRLRPERARCPCQAPSDSGEAYQTGCDACLGWHRPLRFRRVCPLLVDTREGLRCSVDAADVRPYWGRAAAVYGLVLLAVYAAGVLAVFAFLRTIGYPVSIVHVGLPPLWHRVVQARTWFFMHKSQLAFERDRVSEGLLYLTNAYEFDPTNYSAGISLAKHLQAGHPVRSDEVYQRLLREHPDQRSATAQDWFRALLARGSFERISQLARDELLAQSPSPAVWLRALIFAARRLPTDRILREAAASPHPALQRWRSLFELELRFRAGPAPAARAAIAKVAAANADGFTAFYLVEALIAQRDTYAALDLLGQSAPLLDPEATLTLRLDALAAGGRQRLLLQEIDRLLAPTLTPASLPLVKILCAHVIRFPNPEVYDRLAQKIARDPFPMRTDTAGLWFSLFCAAGVAGDHARLHELTHQLRNASAKPFLALSSIEAFFRGETAERTITTFLPVLPLPLEVTYALLERFVPAVATPDNSPPRP